ncbi:MAG: response regulator [Chloroflexi bacterium]|nr:response regulator [Chloroflexota bacterium]
MSPAILVLEDEPLLNQLYTKALQRGGYDVTQAYTMAQARQKLAAQPFDFLLVDLRLPDGIATHLLREFRDRLREQGTHVVILTAEARYRDELQEMGFEHFFEKPISLDMLLRFLGRLKR